ncbi:Rho GDP-dissociation inhibitor 1 [Apostasia shenzhenica]|uniref:Rho GDP-dissociation inhibitor 1 n=1 Tax=Apostasia shenzhenica TaxID=1088818 RepID=A0A2I0AXR9_9ASPA|nr:Rho GDP-dissociation inhibitor 1 [Apostasia shenzhenica]
MAWEEEKDAAGRLREYFEKEVDGQEKKVGDHCGDEVEEVREKEVSLCAYEEEEKDGEEDAGKVLDLGPLVSLIDQMEKDKDDESLRRWKEQLLGTADFNSVGDKLEPDVKILSLSILSLGRPDIILPIPVALNPKGSWFTLKEGSSYRLKFSFSVSNNIVSGLKYTNTVWKTSIKVDRSKEMLGTFSPQLEPYTYVTPEETTPSGIFARGSYSARTKFTDDDGKCYLEINYTFDIRKNWPSASPV